MSMQTAQPKARTQDIPRELEQVRKQHGGVLRPTEVIDWASAHKDSALHARFEWDDSEAAQKYRLWQARDIIASVRFQPSKQGNTRVRAYVSLTPDRGVDSYRSTVDVLSSEEYTRIMIEDALNELRAFRAKYAVLKEVAALDVTIEALRAALRNTAVSSR